MFLRFRILQKLKPVLATNMNLFQLRG